MFFAEFFICILSHTHYLICKIRNIFFHFFWKFNAVFQVQICSPFPFSLIIYNWNNQRITKIFTSAASFLDFILSRFIFLPDYTHVPKQLHRHIIINITLVLNQWQYINFSFYCAICFADIYLFDRIRLKFHPQKCLIFFRYILNILRHHIRQQRNICIISQKLTCQPVILKYLPAVCISHMHFRLVARVLFSFVLWCFFHFASSLETNHRSKDICSFIVAWRF